MMKFQCKNCNAKLQAEETKAGQVFPCPKCSKQVVVPSPNVETIPETPRTPPRSIETTTQHKVHPEVWEIGKQAVGHLVALLVFGIIAQTYLDYRMARVQADLQKQLKSIPKAFEMTR